MTIGQPTPQASGEMWKGSVTESAPYVPELRHRYNPFLRNGYLYLNEFGAMDSGGYEGLPKELKYEFGMIRHGISLAIHDLQIIAKSSSLQCIENGFVNGYYVKNNSYWRKRLYHEDGTIRLFRRVNFSGGSNNNKTLLSAEFKGVRKNISETLIFIELGAKIKYGNTQIGELIL